VYAKYRKDYNAAELRALREECEATMRNEIAHSDSFILGMEDCTHAHNEYADFLTEREMRACFNRASITP